LVQDKKELLAYKEENYSEKCVTKQQQESQKISRYYVLLKLLFILRYVRQKQKGKENRISHWFSSSSFFVVEYHACGVISLIITEIPAIKFLGTRIAIPMRIPRKEATIEKYYKGSQIQS
jgi:hypothetical protein